MSAHRRAGARSSSCTAAARKSTPRSKAAGIEKRQVDGLRITDEPTLDVVGRVLAGTVNTRFVAALTTAGVAAVGLTGADARLRAGRAGAAAPHGRRRSWSISGASASRATPPTSGC